MDTKIPLRRIRQANQHPVREDGARVVYWMIASRRTRFNFGLQRAAQWSRHLGAPLLVLEALGKARDLPAAFFGELDVG